MNGFALRLPQSTLQGGCERLVEEDKQCSVGKSKGVQGLTLRVWAARNQSRRE